MSLPVSQYEALLAQVRGLRRQAQHVQQLADPLLFGDTSVLQEHNVNPENIHRVMEVPEKNLITAETSDDDSVAAQSAHLSVSSEPICHTSRGSSSLYHGTWPVEGTMWNSEPATLGVRQAQPLRHMEVPSVMSFASSSGAPLERVLMTPEKTMRSSQQLEAKVDMVYSLLAMLGGQEHADMGETLFALSTNPESCLAMRESGCIPLLVQLVQSDRDCETRKKATKALHNLIQSQPDEKLRKREMRILKLLETVCAYNEALLNDVEFVCENLPEDGDRHPVQTVAHLMKLSFDEGHRQAICQLGGIHTIARLVEVEHSKHGSTSEDIHCIMMRRYACMALTNLTFGDSGNKTLLCSYREFMKALVVQLLNPCDELRQVTASVLRNLSWRADSSSKEVLKEIGSVKALMKAAMLDNKENTLKSILSALWNLSAHCTENKSEICAVKGALQFLIQMLLYKSAPKSLAIIENAGGILRNISSQIAVRDDYREILREHNCLQILLDQLKSPSLTIVSNACGTLWNLSAKNTTDQELLWELGAPSMLKSLNHSKHKMIAMGSSAALKNLLTAKPGHSLVQQLDSTALSLDLPQLPTLGVRKQKALLKSLDQSLTETFDNLDTPSDKKKVKNEQNQRDIPFVQSPVSESIGNSYTSLNVNVSSMNMNQEKKSKIPQSSGASSLPYYTDSDVRNPCTSTPIKAKTPDIEKQRIPRKKPLSSKKSIDSFHSNKGVKTESINTSEELGNETHKLREFHVTYSEFENFSNESGNGTVSNDKTSVDVSNLKKEDIDNDKHKLKKKNKEIVANMDEKDHCSTEDISDSEVEPSKCQSEFQSASLQPEVIESEVNKHYDHTNVNSVRSLQNLYNHSSSNSSESSSNTKETISAMPKPNVQPNPKPRKLMEKPQPVPRSIPQLKTRCGISSTEECSTSADAKPNSSIILNREESIENNIIFQEDLNEKQDIGGEKNKIGNFNDSIEMIGNTSNRTHSASSIPQHKRVLRSSGIPMSKLPSRISPQKSSTKAEAFVVRKALTNGEEFTNIDEINEPVSSKEISDARYLETTEASEPARIKQESNARAEVTGEAAEVLNKDLNGKYDDILFERRMIFSDSNETCDRHVSGSEEMEISIERNSILNYNKASDIHQEKSVLSNISPVCSPELHGQNELLQVNSVGNYLEEEILSRNCNDEPVKDCDFLTNIKRSESNKSLGNSVDSSQELSYSPRDNCMVFNDRKEERFEKSCNDSANVDTRMLDPDAMIESLDRFTAELVSQASSHLQNKDSLYKSTNNDNTWDENSSPNEATFPSISVSAPNVVSFNSESENKVSNRIQDENILNGMEQNDLVSNDYSSLNTTTMTDSTLIAMEATKIAEAFKEADMSTSVNSLISLELDQVQPPSYMNSLSNSIVGTLDSKPSSPKLIRKKSLPSNIMVKRALNYPLSHNASFDSLDQQITSSNQYVTSKSSQNIPNDISESKKTFLINGPININYSSRNCTSKMPSNFSNLENSSQLFSMTDLENINPPSMLNELTDLCNSLADVATTSIGTETEIFEDCFTHVTDNHLQTENDVTEFSDANSITPIQSSTSSSENTPKKQKSLSKSLTSKQKRALAKERYKTYIIAAEMVMKDSLKQEENSNEFDINLESIEQNRNEENDDSICASKTFQIDTKTSKLSPKERRLSERSRFQTQVLDVSQLPNFYHTNQHNQKNESESESSKEQSPARTKCFRKNILQRRLSNKDRFKTQTLEESLLPPLITGDPSLIDDTEMHLMVEKEANKVLKTLRDTNTNIDEILDCETISLVSNDDESEPNSGSSVNYRTYHKSWGLKSNVPIIAPEEPRKLTDEVGNSPDCLSNTSDDEANKVPPKPKIVKPDEKNAIRLEDEDEQPKGIRGRRKALYSKSNVSKITPKSIKPVRNVTSNLVKNVTASLKSATPKPNPGKPSKIATRPPTKGKTSSISRPVSGGAISTPTNSSIQKNSKSSIPSRPPVESVKSSPKPLERQGTFTKEENSVPVSQTKGKTSDKTRIPTPGSTKSSIPKMSPKHSSIPRPGVFKSASSDRNSKPPTTRIYNRSTSADSRESNYSRRIQSSSSTHSLKGEQEKGQLSGAIKKTNQYQRSDSSTSLSGSNSPKKQVTSKIASIWKKIEESKRKTVNKKDSKKWIEAEVEPLCDERNSNVGPNIRGSDEYAPKRISRLGSFVSVDENEDDEVQEIV